MFLHRADRLIDVARADSCNDAAMLAHDVGDPFGGLREAVAQADDQIPASCSSASRTPQAIPYAGVQSGGPAGAGHRGPDHAAAGILGT